MASTKTAGKFSESFPRTSCLPGALAGITSSGMKTVTVEQAQPPLPDPLRLVARGPETRVMRRKRALARIVPADRGTAPVDWTSTWSEVEAISDGKPAPGKPGSQVLIESRR